MCGHCRGHAIDYVIDRSRSDELYIQSMKDLLGGKGSNLAEMSKIGLSVPPGFTITTSTCAEYNAA